MSIVTSYTRTQWEGQRGWHGVDPTQTDGVILLFREEDDPSTDVLPRVVRRDPNNGWQIWPEDAEPLTPVPYRYYRRRDDGNGWELDDEGADLAAHQQIGIVRRTDEPDATTQEGA
jgi:hypothetical protein